jgi:hypothetical protein
MKRLLIISLLISSVYLADAQVQDIRLNGYAAYVFDNSFDTYYSSNEYIEGKILGGFQWGAGLEVFPREAMGVELLYYRQDTQAPIRYAYSNNILEQSRTIDLSVNYIMLGGNRYMKYGERVEPYGGLLLGAAIFGNKEPEGTEQDSYVKFAWGARLGVNIWASDKVALKLQAQLLSAVQGFGGGLYLGTGGAGAGVSTYSTLLQFGLGGGLSFKLGQNE